MVLRLDDDGELQEKAPLFFPSGEIWNWGLEDFIAIKGELLGERRCLRVAELC
jgi:hypothetical protein